MATQPPQQQQEGQQSLNNGDAPNKSCAATPNACDNASFTKDEAQVVLEIETALLFGGHCIDGSDSDDGVYSSLQHLWSSLGIIESLVLVDKDNVQSSAENKGRSSSNDKDNDDKADMEEEEVKDSEKTKRAETKNNQGNNHNRQETTDFEAKSKIKATQSMENDDDDDNDDDNVPANPREAREWWYQMGSDYWQDEEICPATVNGVLGGFAILSDRDLAGSHRFLKQLLGDSLDQFHKTPSSACCECGAGIGRVSKGLLLPLGFYRCDLVESCGRLLAAAPQYIGEPGASRCRYLQVGLQNFVPEPQSYNVIWVQWVVAHLTDGDFIAFLRRCASALRQGGILVLKDNTTAQGAFEFDTQDSSVTRSIPYLKVMAEMAGLKLVLEQIQTDFPAEIFPVPIMAFVAAK